jgi:ubiquinone/menaquinone biosynthesis C-methylase UbiE
MRKQKKSPDPWDHLQPSDVKRFGEVILNREEQTRWCRAVLLGGLAYMWGKADTVRGLIYDKLELREGDKVLLLGEVIEGCGFVDDVRERIGPAGEIRVVDITDEARDAYIAGKRGSGGQLATWRFDYTAGVADGYFDCVAALQGTQHADDWREVGKELLRVMKPGRRIVLAEIAYSPETMMKIESDMHIEYLYEKIFARIGWRMEEFPYYSPKQLQEAFAGLVSDPGIFVWKGIEVFWGTNLQRV